MRHLGGTPNLLMATSKWGTLAKVDFGGPLKRGTAYVPPMPTPKPPR